MRRVDGACRMKIMRKVGCPCRMELILRISTVGWSSKCSNVNRNEVLVMHIE